MLYNKGETTVTISITCAHTLTLETDSLYYRSESKYNDQL